MRNLIGTMLKAAFLPALALALAILISACGGSSSGGDGATTSDVTEESAAEQAGDGNDSAAAEEVVINVRTEGFRFVPDTIKVKVGQTIRLHLENNDPVIHDYTTDEAEFVVLEANGAHHDHGDEVATQEEGDEHEAGTHEEGHDSGAQVSLQPLHIAAEANGHGDLVFQATEEGEYEFYCSVPGHREAGMVGTIIIEG